MEAYLELCRQQSNKWECKECTLLNNQNVIKCASCGTDKQVANGNVNKTNSTPNKENNKKSDKDKKAKQEPQFVFGFGEASNSKPKELKQDKAKKTAKRSVVNGHKRAKKSSFINVKKAKISAKNLAKFYENLDKIENGKTGLFVFGNNSFGSLGLGADAEAMVSRPLLQNASLELNFKFVASGALCVAAIDNNGDLWTWGPVFYFNF